MSLILDGPASAAITSRNRGVAWLVDLHFTEGTTYYTNAPKDVEANGHTYVALSTLTDVGALTESENTTTEKLVLSFSIVNQAMIALSLGSIDTYRGRAAHLYLQLMNEVFQPAGAPIRRWSGYMDKVEITRRRSSSEGGESAGKIQLHCSRAGMARARNYEGLRLTHVQHRSRYPTDMGLEYLQRLIEQPARWLSKRFQEI